jgi:putative pre-16S rRNA nuclease
MKTVEGPVLGLDLGERRIGLAVSDPGGVIAFPIGALERRGLRADLRALCDLIRERGVVAVAVGLPLHLDGRAGTGAEAARRFAHALGEAASLPVALVDERMTTVIAERTLREAPRGRGRGKRPAKHQVDALAATLILRTYLEQPRAGRA